jgi:hypothetical protein
MTNYICGHCGENCNVVEIDEGIGPYEYWGAKSVHHDFVKVSDCCHEDFHEGGCKLIKIEKHKAIKDHNKLIKKGDSYKIYVYRHWKKNGPSWITTKKFSC